MTTLNGHESTRYPGNINMSFAHVEGESLLMVRYCSKMININYFIN